MAIGYNALRAIGLGAQGASLGTLVVRIATDTSDLARDLNATMTATTSFGTRLAQSMGVIFTGIVKGAAVASAAVAALGVREFGRFEQEMARASAVFGGLNKQIRADLEDTARTLSMQTTQDAVELAKGYQVLASAGLTAAQSQQALAATAQFAVAGNMDLAKSIDYLVGVQNALGLSSQDATENMMQMTRVSDALSKANQISKGTIEDFAKSMTGAFAEQLRLNNKSLEEGLAMMAVLADRNVKGAAASTQGAMAMRDLMRAAVDNSMAFRAYNVAILDTRGAMRPMVDIVEDLEKAFDKMSPAQRRVAIEQMGFVDRSSRAILAFVGTSKALREYQIELDKASGTTKKMNDEILGTFYSQVTMLWNSFKNLLITVGVQLVPALKILTQLFRDMADPKSGLGIIVEMIAKWVGLNLEVKVTMLAKAMKSLGLIIAEVGEVFFKSFVSNFDVIQDRTTKIYNHLVDLHNLALKIAKLTPATALFVYDLKPMEHIAGFDLTKAKEAADELSAKFTEAKNKLMGWAAPEVTKALETVRNEIKKTKSETELLAEEMHEANRLVIERNTQLGLPPKTKAGEYKMNQHGIPEGVWRERTKAEWALEMGLPSDDTKLAQNQVEIEQAKEHVEALKKVLQEQGAMSDAYRQEQLKAIEAYNRKLFNYQMAQRQFQLHIASDMFNDLATIAEVFGGKQSAMYKAMFTASKAFAIAESTVKIMQGIANAASLPWPLNLAAMAQVVAATASIVQNIAAVKLEFGGGKATGGPVSSNTAYMIGEKGPEMFVPRSNGTIVPNNHLMGNVEVNVINQAGVDINVARRNKENGVAFDVLVRKVSEALGSDIRDGRGELPRSIQDSFGARRGTR